MQHLYLRCVLLAILFAGMPGCGALSGLGMRQTTLDRRVPLSEVPAPARVTIERLTVGGEIRVLKRTDVKGRTVYHVEAVVRGEEVVYDVTSSGEVLTGEEDTACALALNGVGAMHGLL